MLRFAIVLFAVIGAAYMLPKFFPTLGLIAFTISGMSITWLMLVSLGVAFAGIKVTK